MHTMAAGTWRRNDVATQSVSRHIRQPGVRAGGGHSISKVVGVPLEAWCPYPFPDTL